MLRALQGDIVETRIIRSNYGISFKTIWNPEVHESAKYQRQAAKNKYKLTLQLLSIPKADPLSGRSMSRNKSGSALKS